MTILWYDRKDYKEKLSAWLNSDHKFSVIGVPDTQERKDIVGWIKETTKLEVGSAIFDYDVAIKKFKVIKDLTTNLGHKDTFYNFFAFYDILGKDKSKVNIDMSVGDRASSNRGDTITKKVDQKAEVIYSPSTPEKSLEVLREEQIDKLLDEFIKDVKELTKKNGCIFLIQFGEEGFNKLDREFKNWFLHEFCSRIISLENVKICILNQGNLDEFRDFNRDYQDNLPEYLTFDKMMEEAEKYSGYFDFEEFCRGLIPLDANPENTASYCYFKGKLVKREKEISIV